jgi:2,4-dienoyl-CoA reductase-like NADH-dependent reductase (Old Yellow Enzyme family)
MTIANHWTKSQIGIKLSPGLNGVGAFVANDSTLPTYDYLFGELNRFSPGYVHLIRPINNVSGTAVAILQEGTYKRYRPMFNGTLIANVGFDRKSANELIASGDADLVSFARHYVAKPDLPERFWQNAPLVKEMWPRTTRVALQGSRKTTASSPSTCRATASPATRLIPRGATRAPALRTPPSSCSKNGA